MEEPASSLQWKSCPGDVLISIGRQACLSTRDVIALSLVCREWRSAMLQRPEPGLWGAIQLSLPSEIRKLQRQGVTAESHASFLSRWLQRRSSGFRHVGLALTLPVRARSAPEQEHELHRKAVSLFSALMGGLARESASLKLTLSMDGAILPYMEDTLQSPLVAILAGQISQLTVHNYLINQRTFDALCQLTQLKSLRCICADQTPTYNVPTFHLGSGLVHLSSLQQLVVTAHDIRPPIQVFQEMSQLPQIASLSLSCVSSCMHLLAELSTLRQLHLSEQNVSLPSSLSKLDQLRDFSLIEVRFDGHTEALGHMTSLKRLDFLNCAFDGSPAAALALQLAICQLTQLTYFSMESMPGLVFDLSCCKGLANLNTLSLWRVHLQPLQSWPARLQQLQVLNISASSGLTHFPTAAEAAMSCPQLQTLYLRSDWQIDSPLLVLCQALPKLQQLEVYTNAIEGWSEASLCYLAEVSDAKQRGDVRLKLWSCHQHDADDDDDSSSQYETGSDSVGDSASTAGTSSHGGSNDF